MSENMVLPHPYLREDRLMSLFFVVMEAVESERAFPFGLQKLKKMPLVDDAVQVYFQQAGDDEEAFKMGRNQVLASALSLWEMMGLITQVKPNQYDVTDAGKECVQLYRNDPMRIHEAFGRQILNTLWFAQTGYADGQLGEYLRQNAPDATDAHIDATISLLAAFNLFNRESSTQMVTHDSLAQTQPHRPIVDEESPTQPTRPEHADETHIQSHYPVQADEIHTQPMNNPDAYVFALTQPDYTNQHADETFIQPDHPTDETFTQPIGDFYQDNPPHFEQSYQTTSDDNHFTDESQQAMDAPVDNTPYSGQSDTSVDTDSRQNVPLDYDSYIENSATGGLLSGLAGRAGRNRGGTPTSSPRKPSFGRSIGNSGDVSSSDNPPVQDPPVDNSLPPMSNPTPPPQADNPPMTASHTDGHQPFSPPRRNIAPPPPPPDNAPPKVVLGGLADKATTDKTPTQPTRFGQKPNGTTNVVGPRGGNRQVAPPPTTTPSDAPPPSQTRVTPTMPTPPPTTTPPNKNDTAIGYITGKSPRDNVGFGGKTQSTDTSQTNTSQRGTAMNNRPTGPRNTPKTPTNNTPPPTGDISAYYEQQLPDGRVIKLSRQVVHDWMAEKNVGIDEAIRALIDLKSHE